MSQTNDVTNIVFAGIGGQGVLKASDICADAAFRAGFDIKKSELHGMSQRGGSVSSDVRFGRNVASPMIPAGEADVLVVLEETQVDLNRPQLRNGGALVVCTQIDEGRLANRKAMNVALLGVLSRHLPQIPEQAWKDAIAANLPEKVLEANLQAFALGREQAPATAG